MAPKPTDLELVQRTLSGEPEAFNVLYFRYNPEVRHLLAQKVASPQDREDLGQQIWLSAYRYLRYFRGDCQVRTWIWQIAKNTINGHIARVMRRREHLEEISLETGTDEEGQRAVMELPDHRREFQPEQALFNKLLGEDVMRALVALPEAYRRAVLLRHLADASYEEIGRSEGMSLALVKTRIFRGCQRLRMQLSHLVQ